MQWKITEEQHNLIKNEMPNGFDFSYQDDTGEFIHDNYWVDKWSFNVSTIINNALGVSYEELKTNSIEVEEIEPISFFKIGQYSDCHFCEMPFNLFDFTTMLKREYSASKKVIELQNGRPERAEYYIESKLVAKRYFIFETNEDNLLTKRKEELVYIKEDGSESEKILIKYKEIDLTDLVDGALAMKEREDARKNIINSLKAFLGGVLIQALQLNLTSVTSIIKPFWDNYSEDRNNFIELGTHDWAESLSGINLEIEENYSWLAIPIAENVTIRDYIVSRLTY